MPRKSPSPAGTKRGTRPTGLRGITGGGKSTARKRGHLGLVGGTKAAKKLGAGGGTKAAKRLGAKRPASKAVQRRVPNRRVQRPGAPARPGSLRRLIRNGIGVPKRSKGTLRWKRPTLATRRKARRALVKATLLGIGAFAARVGRWWRSKVQLWDARVRGITAPTPIRIPIPAAAKAQATPQRRKEVEKAIRAKYRNPYPQLTGRRSAGTATKEKTRVSNPTEAVVEAFAQLGMFDPENATAIRDFIHALPEMYEQAAASLTANADRFSSDQPVQAPVIELLQQAASAMAGLSDLASEAAATFENVHAEDIARMNQDRGLNNEKAWDVTQNQ